MRDPVLVSVHQPNFMLWLKLLDKILASNVYVAYDTAQYTKSEFHSRQKVKTHNGPAWLSVPVRHVKGTRQAIKDVRIDNDDPFRRRHLKTLHVNYRSTRYFDEVYPIIEKVYARDHERLVDLSLDLIETLCAYLGSPVRVVRASALPHAGDKVQRLVQLSRAAGGTAHLTSTFGGDHQIMAWEPFQHAGMPVYAQEFVHPKYGQIGRDFVPQLAAVDMLFACGTGTAGILASRRRLVPIDLSRIGPGTG